MENPKISECKLGITKTRLFKYIENFTSKTENFQIKKKKTDIFHISAQNIDCGYSLDCGLCEAVLTSTHNQCFRAKTKKKK